jgi:hypothetical protein
MPNWCTNSLSVSAKKSDDLMRFLEKVSGTNENGEKVDFTFATLVPQPQDEEDWYNWNINNWGTKWDVGDSYISIDDEKLNAYISFDTAWSPPVEWLEKVIPMFPELNFRLKYFEGGVGFAGVLEGEEGEVVDNTCVGSNDEEYWHIATDGMDDDEIEERAMERIENEALDYWDYTLEQLVRYVGEENKDKLENLLIVQKLIGEMTKSSQDELNGADIEEVIEQLIGKEKFYKSVFEEKKKSGELRPLAV